MAVFSFVAPAPRPFVEARTSDACSSRVFAAQACSVDEAFDLSGPDIDRLQRLQGNGNNSHDLRSWLASRACAKGWRWRVFVLKEGARVEAAIFLKERVLFGIGTGYFVGGDHLGDPCLLCEPSGRRRVLPWFINWLLRREAFLIQLFSEQPHGFAIRTTDVPESISMRASAASAHWRHQLATNFDDSIREFGHRTRRNLRHALRTAKHNGWHFVPSLSTQEIMTSTETIERKTTHRASIQTLRARQRLSLGLSGFFSAGLRDAHGEWLSTISGARGADGVTRVLWQCNVPVHGVSMCTIMRALLIQAEVELGSRRIEYVGGTNPLMEKCCHEESCTRTVFASSGFRTVLFRFLVKHEWQHHRMLRESSCTREFRTGIGIRSFDMP